jgi:NADP-dependent aldehyde dehydrogenase
MGSGQFCTNPGVVFLVSSAEAEKFIENVTSAFLAATPQAMLGPSVQTSFLAGVEKLTSHGAILLCGGQAAASPNTCENTLLRVTDQQFMANAEGLQTEIFGNGALFVVCEDVNSLESCLKYLEGNLTGSIYSSTTGEDDAAYAHVANIIRQKVGRLLNDKMPTGVAVSSAMNHGGPFPATGHPGFTAVGLPAAITRFAALHCYDNVRPDRLPPALANENPLNLLRLQDGEWTRSAVAVPGN